MGAAQSLQRYLEHAADGGNLRPVDAGGHTPGPVDHACALGSDRRSSALLADRPDAGGARGPGVLGGWAHRRDGARHGAPGARAGAAAALGGAWGGILIAVAWFMSPVRLDQIGGFYLTVLLATIAIAGSFPIGVLVGIGRVSQLPVVRVLSVLYLELLRGLPFIAVLLSFSVFCTLLSW